MEKLRWWNYLSRRFQWKCVSWACCHGTANQRAPYAWGMLRDYTGKLLPVTHLRGRIPIDGVFCTSGVECSAATLLPSRVGVGDHKVFLLDLASKSVLGDIFPSVIPISWWLLNYASDRIKLNYITLLKQLTNRHCILRKVLVIDKDLDNSTPAMIQIRMSRVDLELEQFMKSAEKYCHKYKWNNFEWSPYASVLIHLRWLLNRVQKYMCGQT